MQQVALLAFYPVDVMVLDTVEGIRSQIVKKKDVSPGKNGIFLIFYKVKYCLCEKMFIFASPSVDLQRASE